MNMTVVAVAVIVILVVIAVAIWLYMRQRRTEQLVGQFGPEYGPAVKEYGSRERAESALESRAERVQQLNIHSLSAPDRTRFADQWRDVQSQFVDSPEHAVAEADNLITEAMQARGYPMGDFEQRAADISVDHPRVVEHYRAGHELASRSAQGNASTEDLRQAMVHYRALFEDILGTSETATRKAA